VADHAPTASLSAFVRRRADVERLAGEPWDLLVVGGGIVGCGVLLDAVSRGLKAALIEQDDIASGTSSRSSRLIHGGLRYLPQLRFGLVREALEERSRLLRLAPHLVRLEPLLFPIYGAPVLRRTWYASGVLLYDLLGARRDGGWAGHLTRDQVLEWAPRLRADDLRGGIIYHDGFEDDARLTLAVLRTATGSGGLAATRVRARGAVTVRDRVAGVEAEDLLGGGRFRIRAAQVVDATGVWAASDHHPFGRGPRIVPSRGSHLVLPRSRMPAIGGLTLPIRGRLLFLLPWDRHWIAGTTDGAWHGPADRPRASAEEVDELLAGLNRSLDLRLTRDDVVGTYAGLRPLAADGRESSRTSRLSREHRIERRADGLVRISGGKYTTYRVIAREAVDAALGDGAGHRPSRTGDLPLHGAVGRQALDAIAARLGSDEIDASAARLLVSRHGSEADAIVRLGRELGLLDRLTSEADHLEVEVVHAVRCEHALSLDDFLARRVRLAPQLRDRGASIAPRVAELMGRELGWDGHRERAEVGRYLAGAEQEYGVPA
jgi:glycerol-3-phosphate dehydrogenase